MRRTSQTLSLIILAAMIVYMIGCGKKEEPVPDKIHAAHILLMYKGSMRAPEDITRTKEEALQEIQKILDKVKAGGDFAELAQHYSDCPSSSKGGDLNEFGRGVMAKPFEDAAFKLKIGEMSDIVETPFGYHIIKRLG